MFDSIFPYGDKRWVPTILLKELQDRDDAPLYAVSLLFDILKPYSEQIDLIGIGNHEYSTLKYHGINMVKLLIMKLNQELNGHKILYGGYTGYMGYRFQRNEMGCRKILKILYHHGSGGGAPVTRGMIDINRKETNWPFDIFIYGHKHNRFGVHDVRMHPVFNNKGEGYIIASDIRAIQTGAFYRNYPEMKDTDLPTYEEVGQHQPKPIGGVFCNVELIRVYNPNIKKDNIVFKIRAEI